MRLKTLTVSVVVLAILSAVVFIARRPGPPPSKDPRVGQSLVDQSTVEKAAKLRISDQGKTVTLSRQSDGTWRDDSYYDLPADFTKLSGFVGNLTEAKLDRLVTTNPERIERLEFKDTKIELLDAAAKPVWAVTLGKNAESGGRFVRFDDEKKAYLASLNAWIDTEAKSWANAELLNLKADDIAKVEIGFPAVPESATEPKTAAMPASTVTVSRAKKDADWTADKTPANDRVKADKISSLLGYIGTIRFTDTSEPNDPNVAAAKAIERVFKLTTFDGKTYTVAMGRKPEEKKLKVPTPGTDGKTGPASLGSVTQFEKKEEKAKEPEKKVDEPATVKPEFETVPAGPVYVFVSSSDASAPVNALMQKRAFQIGDYIYTALPQKPDELFEPAPAPKPEEKKAEPAKAAQKSADEMKAEATQADTPAKK
jgi:hypothetical protein